MEVGAGRKRGRFDSPMNGNGGPKKFRPEMESFSSGIGSKSKPCTKFFSTSGCPFGEGCHFLHFVPGGFKAVSQMLNLGSQALPPPMRNQLAPPSFPDGSSSPSVKNRLCKKYNSAEGCKFGDKCHYAHGEWELGKAATLSYEDPRAMGPMPGRMGRQMEYPVQQGTGFNAGFGASATAKISVDASLAGPIIGKNGANSKHICRVTGVKLAIRDHEMDPNSRNIELEGTYDQINQASAMVRDIIGKVGQQFRPPPAKNPAMHSSANNFKTKLCENFTKGSCTFGDRCHFAHGSDEIRKSGM